MWENETGQKQHRPHQRGSADGTVTTMFLQKEVYIVNRGVLGDKNPLNILFLLDAQYLSTS